MTRNTRSSRKRSTPRRPSQAEKQALIHKRTRSDHREERSQDYVETIAELIHADGEARAIDIARRMGVTHVTVGKMVARLQREGLVTTRPYRSIFLTERGRKIAEEARARHRVVVDFLIALGVPPDAAEVDAEGIEHHVSRETLEVFRSYIGRRAKPPRKTVAGSRKR